jgi:glycosyltransferase involved in cell wall biosynthesis
MRVCVLTNILPPYRIGFYNELARLTDLHVVLDALSTPDRDWKIDPATVKFRCTVSGNRHKSISRPGVGYAAERRFFNLSERTMPELNRIRPDIVVSAELGPRTIQAALYAIARQIPLVCFWEGTPHTESRIPPWKQWMRRWLAARADAFWVNGRESAEYAQSLGVPPTGVHPGMTGVDTSFFLNEAANWSGQRDTERQRLGLRGTVFVCSGSLSARKGIAAYLAAMRRMLERSPRADVSFLFIGDGEHRADVETFAREHPQVNVVITGFVQLAELPRLYVCGDCFVLPTLEDCWPLATLEPLVCGLPQIFSRYNGAAADLAQWPHAGVSVDPLDTETFAQHLLDTANKMPIPPTARIRVDVANFYSPAVQAQRALASCQSVLSGAPLAPAVLR